MERTQANMSPPKKHPCNPRHFPLPLQPNDVQELLRSYGSTETYPKPQASVPTLPQTALAPFPQTTSDDLIQRRREWTQASATSGESIKFAGFTIFGSGDYRFEDEKISETLCVATVRPSGIVYAGREEDARSMGVLWWPDMNIMCVYDIIWWCLMHCSQLL